MIVHDLLVKKRNVHSDDALFFRSIATWHNPPVAVSSSFVKADF